MSQTDPRAVAKAVVFQISQIDAGYGCCLTEGAMDLIAHALADAERRGLERAAKVVEQMKIQTCAIRNETAIIHELLLKVESRIPCMNTVQQQVTQLQATLTAREARIHDLERGLAAILQVLNPFTEPQQARGSSGGAANQGAGT